MKRFPPLSNFQSRQLQICELCTRQVNHLTKHHLVPKQKDGKSSEKINICSACHRQLHHSFSNKYLAEELNTMTKIQTNPEFRKFLRWVKKQDPGKRIRVRSKNKKYISISLW